MTTIAGVLLRRIEDNAFYAGAVDRRPVFTARRAGAAVYRRRDDAVHRARALGGEKWGETLSLEATS